MAHPPRQAGGARTQDRILRPVWSSKGRHFGAGTALSHSRRARGGRGRRSSSSSAASRRSARRRSVSSPSASGAGSARTTSIAMNGEAGFQLDLLMPGLRFKLWPVFSVAKYPWVQVPAGGIGVVIAQVGAPLPVGAKSARYDPSFGDFSDMRTFLEAGGQKGVQRPVLPPGTLAPIHPVAFLVITSRRGLRRARLGRPLAVRDGQLGPQSFGLVPGDLRVSLISSSDGPRPDRDRLRARGRPASEGRDRMPARRLRRRRGARGRPARRTRRSSARCSAARTSCTTTTRTSRRSSTAAAASACSTIRCCPAHTS